MELPVEGGYDTGMAENSLYRLKVKSLEGRDVDLKDFAGRVTLIVNLASE